MSKATPNTDVDAYVEAAPEAAQPHLRRLRRLVLTAVPDAAETISYGMPTYEVAGRRLAHLAGDRRHVAIYGLVHVDQEIPAELAEFVDHRSTLHFRFDRALPEAALAAALRQKADSLR